MTTTVLEVESSLSLLAHKDLIDPRLWDRLVDRVQSDHEFQGFFGSNPETEQREMAERITNEALGFLRFCGEGSGGFGPSPLVDIGWHTFILYTREYAAFCDQVAGRFIHHEPNDVPGLNAVIHGPSDTAQAMIDIGITVDMDLWKGHAECGDSSGPSQNCTCS